MRAGNSKMRRAPLNARSGEAGFSLIELLITVTLFTVITGAIYGMMKIATSDRFTTNNRVELMQSVRNALNAIGRDALNAGNGFPREGTLLPDNIVYTANGLPIDTNTTLDVLPPVVPGRRVNANNFTNINTDQVTFLSQDLTFNNGLPINVTAVAADGSQITIDTRGPDGIAGNADDITNAIFGTNDLIMISGTYTIAGPGGGVTPVTALGRVTTPPAGSPTNNVYFAATAPLGFNLPGTVASNGIARVNSGARTANRVTWVRYRVLADGTLVRTVVGNTGDPGGQLDQPLAYNVETMSIEYVQSNGVTSFNPAAGPDQILGNADDTPLTLFNIRQVRVTIMVRATDQDKRNNWTQTATLTSTFNTRNLGYDTR